jgi:hypothetical protein
MKMRKSVFLLGVALLLLVWVPVALATTFTETFLGTNRDDTQVSLDRGWRAEASFNLVGAGDQLKVFNALSGGSQQGSSINPNPDATGFVANGETIISAHLYITVSSYDEALDALSIRAGSADGSSMLLDYTSYDLDGHTNRIYKDFDFNLVALGFTSYLNDGKYLTLVLSQDSRDNDFYLDQVKLVVEANPKAAPEPMSLLLLGLGLLGLGAARRKK